MRRDERTPGWAEQAEGSARQRVTGSWDILMGQDIKALVDALGGCERIQKTPMPFGYLAQQRIFMLTWLLTYPLCLVGDYGWWTIPVSDGAGCLAP